MDSLTPNDEWILVRADVLPDVYRRVLAAQADLSSGRIRSVSEAARLHGLSRSAYYKYRDVVMPYVGRSAPTTMTVELLLQDCPGVLSGVLSAFAGAGANILTVNQDSPASGKAQATVCARTDAMSAPIDLFIEQIGRIPGVQHIISVRRQNDPASSEAPKGEAVL